MNVLFGNFTLFAPLIKKVMLGIPQTKAMLSTGISFTTMFAGQREDPQIRAKEVETTMFLRCVREEDLYQGLEKIRKIAARYGSGITASPPPLPIGPISFWRKCFSTISRM